MSFDHLDDILMAPNPISDAKIVGDGIAGEIYISQPNGAKRGSLEYVMNGSDLAEFANCPHRWVNGYKDEGTEATEWGTLIDCLLMDHANFEKRFILCPATYTVASGKNKGQVKKWNWNAGPCKEWREVNNPDDLLIEVKHEMFEDAKDAMAVIQSDPVFSELFETSRKQVMITGIFDDKETGLRIPVKSLLDIVPPDAGYLVDFKTTNNAHPRAWKKKVFEFGYHVQAVRHMDLWNAATGEQRNEFKHAIQEQEKPFQTAKRFLSSEYLAIGRRSYITALKRYAQCLKTNEWPDYDIAEGANDMVIDGWLCVSPEAWMI